MQAVEAGAANSTITATTDEDHAMKDVTMLPHSHSTVNVDMAVVAEAARGPMKHVLLPASGDPSANPVCGFEFQVKSLHSYNILVTLLNTF
jgi:hypothetical protein